MGERYFQLGRADMNESVSSTSRQTSVRKMSKGSLMSAPPETGQVIRTALPDTFDGIRYEIGKMVNYVKAAAQDPFMIAHTKAVVDGYSQAAASQAGMNGKTLEGIDPRNIAIEALESWCREHYAYVNDPPNIEVIQTPKRMVKQTLIPAEVTREVMAPIFEALTAALGPQVTQYEVPGLTAGDCDEGSTLMNAHCAAWKPDSDELLAIMGTVAPEIRPIRFRFGGNGGTLHHVWARPYLGEQGIDSDLTEPTYGLGDYSKFEQYEEVEVEL
jgi:hypothetical protein